MFKTSLRIIQTLMVVISFASAATAPDFTATLQAAQEGDADAQYNLGVMYYYGEGVEEDNEKAFYWFEKSAQGGHVAAQYNLAEMYYGNLCKKG